MTTDFTTTAAERDHFTFFALKTAGEPVNIPPVTHSVERITGLSLQDLAALAGGSILPGLHRGLVNWVCVNLVCVYDRRIGFLTSRPNLRNPKEAGR